MLRHRNGLVLPILLRKTGTNTRTRKAALSPHFSAFCGLVFIFLFPQQNINSPPRAHRPPGLIKFPMPALRHENKGNPGVGACSRFKAPAVEPFVWLPMGRVGPVSAKTGHSPVSSIRARPKGALLCFFREVRRPDTPDPERPSFLSPELYFAWVWNWINKPWLTNPDPKLTSAWLGGSVRWRRAIKGETWFWHPGRS